MYYRGEACELIGEKEILGQQMAWVRLQKDGRFIEVPREELEPHHQQTSLSYIQYVATAGKIQDEVARKRILSPYESSLLPLPHQILVLEKVMQSSHSRFLLADEVGMGKTIEAGLIIKELKLRGDIRRILAIVPKSSMMQWQSELKQHFNELFQLYDAQTISSMARTFANLKADESLNVWKQHHQIIVSTDALKPITFRQGWTQQQVDEYNKYRMEAVLEADFDLVIIDEAHKMGGASPTVSRYQLAQALCNAVPNVLLLTATPHRGKADHFRRVLQLLDPIAFDGDGLPPVEELAPYVIRTEKRLAVDYEGKALFNERKTHKMEITPDAQRHQLQIALYDAVSEYVREGFKMARRNRAKGVGLMMVLLQRLASSSTAAILSAIQGRLTRMNSGIGTAAEDLLEEEDFASETPEEASAFMDETSEEEPVINIEDGLLEALVEQAQHCMQQETDAKAEALYQKLNQLQQLEPPENFKALIFTEFRATQHMLVDYLSSKGFRVVFVNGGQNLEQRRKALESFKNEAALMVATDAAGESLNMQFCHLIFNYDLPWNPMMIEQRIGRVDRIGQKRRVEAYNMLSTNSIDRRVYEVIEEKLSAIIEQLGIDKTSDVLDSTLDLKEVNKLYLESLLNPESFQHSSENWLDDIREKLKNYQSTASALPQVQEHEIEYKKASDVKHSPLPHWMQSLIRHHVTLRGGQLRENLLGITEIELEGSPEKITFDADTSLQNPGVEHLSLQHPWIQELLHNIAPVDTKSRRPVLKSMKDDETPGYWSLWEITARQLEETLVHYQAIYVTDDGHQYTAYANDIWKRLLTDPPGFQLAEEEQGEIPAMHKEKTEEALHLNFQNMKTSLEQRLSDKKEKRIRSYSFQQSRINRIGISNIRASKKRRLEKEHTRWLHEYERNRKVMPGLRQLLSLRIHG